MSANHEGTPAGVSVVPAQSSVTIPSSIKLTVSADRHLYGTGYSVSVVDEDKGVTMGPCSQPCDLSAGTFWADNANPQPRHFHGELRGPGGGLVATSGQVTVDVRKHTWNIVSVVPNPASRFVPGSIQFVATLDHTTSGTPYSIYIYDEDNPSTPTTCNQYICGRYINRQWPDNVSPRPGRVRVEVRNADGDIASNTVNADAQFRRFIFSPSLAFSTQTSSTGAVVHKATVTLASTDPSLNGTPYRIKIKKADGTEACSAPQYGCTATVNAGETYRGMVEDAAGHVFGASGTWLVSDGQPELVMLGAVDLAYLATRFPTVSALCQELLIRGGFAGGDTLPDAYQACEAALAAGKTVAQALVAVAGVAGGAALIHQLASDQIAPPLPASGEETPDDSIVWRPLPLPIWIEVQRLADRLQQANSKLGVAEAEEVATQCKLFMGRVGRPADDCLLHPIIAPGSDMPGVTKNTLAGLAREPAWVQLHYESQEIKKQTVPRNWYEGIPPCENYDKTVTECDEFPLYATVEGGLPSPRGITPSLALVPPNEHRVQGGHMGSFNTTCGLNSRPNNPPFWVIPLYWEGPKTQKLCNGWSSSVTP